MSKFTFIREDSSYVGNAKQTVEFSAVSLDDILSEFQYFLKGAGFHFDGDIVIEEAYVPVKEINAELNDYRMGEQEDAN